MLKARKLISTFHYKIQRQASFINICEWKNSLIELPTSIDSHIPPLSQAVK